MLDISVALGIAFVLLSFISVHVYGTRKDIRLTVCLFFLEVHHIPPVILCYHCQMKIHKYY